MAVEDVLLRLRLQGEAATQSGLLKTARNVAVIGTAAAGAAKALYDIGRTFDDAYDTLRVQTGATGTELARLQNDWRAVVKTVPTDFASASTAVSDVHRRLGLVGPDLRRVSTQFLELSRITDTDVSENVASVTRLFGDWEVATGKQASTLDLLFRASQGSGAGVADLAKQAVQFGAPLRQMGFSLEESVAMFGQFEKAGVNTQTMMPGLKFALKTFLADGRDPARALAETFQGIRSGSITATDALKVFGQRAGADMVEAVQQGRFNLDALTRSLVDGKDTIRGAAADTNDLAESWQLFKNRALLKLEPIATRVFDVLGMGMNKLPGQIEPATNAVSDLVGWLGRNKDLLIAIGAGVAAYVAATRTYAAATTAVAFATGGWTASFWALNTAMTANPIGLVVVALAAVAGGLVYAYQKSETFRGVVNALWGGLKSGFSWVRENWPLLRTILTGPFGVAARAISRTWDSIPAGAKAAINTVIDVFNTGLGAINAVTPGPVKIAGKTVIPGIPDIPMIPKLAHGGLIAAAGAAIVGDEGPELLELPRGAIVHDAPSTAASTAAMRSGAGARGLDEAAIRAIVAAVMQHFPDIVLRVGGRELARVNAQQLATEAAFA